jgi:MoaA/NifB/PqqE/SkfB family radical SAM enzyme
MKNNKYSDFKIVGHPEKVESFREGRVTAPLYVRIKPLNVCNDSCWWCAYHAPEHSQMHTDMEKRDSIKLPKMLEIIEDLAGMGVKAVTYSGGGEPLAHPQAAEILRHTVQWGLDLSIITNGSFLQGERADALTAAKWVRVSMDYADGEQLEKFRRTPAREFEKRLENLRRFAAMKPATCDLGVNFIVHRENCLYLFAIARQLRDAGVENVRFSPMWVSPGFQAYHEAIAPTVLLSLGQIQKELCGRPFTVNTTYDLHASAHSPERRYTKCLVMQTVPVIGADLNVYACHNKAYDSTGKIGSIKDRKFSELWFSEEARAVFEGLNPQCVCRHQCANDSKNVIYHGLADMHVDNFV